MLISLKNYQIYKAYIMGAYSIIKAHFKLFFVSVIFCTCVNSFAVERTITPVDSNGNPIYPSKTISMSETADSSATVQLVNSSGNLDLPKEIGVWSKNKNFSHINLICIQIWSCYPNEDILHGPDTYVEVSNSQSTSGTCSAGDGPTDGCNVCLASEPTEKCFWELKKK